MLLEFRNFPLKLLAKFRHATIGVVVERCKSIVNVFWSEKGETHPVNCQKFIDHTAKKKVTLKTLAKVLSTITSQSLLTYRSLFSFEAQETKICWGIDQSCGRYRC